MSNKQLVADLLSCFAGQQNTIAIPVPFIRFMGSTDGALLLSQILYWSDRTSNPDGWFYKTYSDWEEEICLSERQVRRHVKRMVEAGFLETKVKKVSGNPTLHYRLNRDSLSESFLEFTKERRLTEAKKLVTNKREGTNRQHGKEGRLPEVRNLVPDTREGTNRHFCQELSLYTKTTNKDYTDPTHKEARAASLCSESESEPASQLSELPTPSVQNSNYPKNSRQDQFSGPRQKYFSSAQSFAQQFEPLPPWRDSRGANGLNREFCEYVRTEYLATLPCNEGKTPPTLADAKQWVARREFDERIEQVEIRWQAYQEFRQGDNLPQSILQQIFMELDRLKLSIELPQQWQEITKTQIVQDLPPNWAEQYLNYLRSQEAA